MIEHAILLSAGQGSRLLPLTAERPKCLIDFSGRSLIEWQIEMLARGGVRRIDVVTGFMTDMLEEHLNAIHDPRVEITVRFNPFFKVADNLGSCWIAREAMHGDFLILNGDTLVSEDIVARVQEDNPWPVAVTVDVKANGYDSDDMKVERTADGRLVHIGKTLTAAQSNAESIGFLAFRGQGADLFRETVRQAMRTPEGVQHWYLKVIDSIAPTGQVGTVSIEGMEWAEVDFLNDIEIATKLTDTWV
ncbi:nucleotidyl transferase [Novosphingobium sp. Rr 2-17]|uniref:phosphocholine cytidylyltransferase family protein n=1 Tax=Novosphingobium sp. Rr 2-17 TaxID=555793 RepID=UPI000269A1E1|nr:phosphocholine cytidylyltransferase family protein [Novosphingobium sp. Rr 2-17]EIZ79149.1 nucleotidyl transferase [Novosphingobium sp. Rr 2-17]